ncbi:MAG TPA: phage tail sheath subtilisin-like domain-containing protein [Thermoanaerobaculia bacterium]|nr:phage tail sheath subtilisin-like domain-containing protein [Thermoanaerobaculia bacterium]
MPEYLAPGVYVEEVSFRAKSIEGVSTTTTAFVGPTRYGPIELVPDVITSLVEFERIYGDRQPLDFGGGPIHNYMWHAVRMFFENGGKRLYVARVFAGRGSVETLNSPLPSPLTAPIFSDGVAISENTGSLLVWARFPGSGGNMQVRISLTAGPNVYDTGTATLRGVVANEVVIVNSTFPPTHATTPNQATAGAPDVWWTEQFFNGTSMQWRLNNGSGTRALDNTIDNIRVVTANVTIIPDDPNIAAFVYQDLAIDSRHRRNGADDSLAGQFAANQPSLGRARSIPIVMDLSGFANGIGIVQHLLTLAPNLGGHLKNPVSSDDQRSHTFQLTGGDDGALPGPIDYQGVGGDPSSKVKSGLKALEDIDEVSIVAAPGSTVGHNASPIATSRSMAILQAVVTHASQMRYRIAVLDSGNDQTIADVREMRGKIDSTYAAFYYPWITEFDPVTQKDVNLPPSGAVCGIYARNDINRGVYKAPANEVVDGAIGLEKILNKAQQDILNPLGINCFRFFEGRGYRLWGARTTSSDPEWKYVNLRRYFAYLEHSIDKGTQWAVFEPNGERLWANIRITITDFLFNEWQNGALLGDRAEKAFFVKCDRSTMTQNDLDNGRLVCLVGVAALRPAEYVIIRIGQWTADRKI